VTDPPYELGFMGKGWDRSGVAYDPETWRQALRVLRPGGHALEGHDFVGVDLDAEGLYLPIAEARIRACGATVLRG
jgi:hypothetical protein